MDPRLDENEAELGVLVFAVTLEMLSDRDGLEIIVSAIPLYIYIYPWRGKLGRGPGGPGGANLLDQHVQVLGDLRSEAWWRAKNVTPSVKDQAEAKPKRGGRAEEGKLYLLV